MRKKGFTLIEMMAIIVILAVIIVFSFPSILELLSNNDIKNKEEQLSNLYLSTENYIAQNYKDEYNSLPFYITIKELIENDYIRIDDKVTAYEEDDVVEVNKDGNGVWTYTFKKNLFDISKVATHETYDKLIKNSDGALIINLSSSDTAATDYKQSKLKDIAPELEVGKTYRLTATTTGDHKCIWLSKDKIFFTFNSEYKPSNDPTKYKHEFTITNNDLNSTVYWYASGKSSSATISDIRIIEIDK